MKTCITCNKAVLIYEDLVSLFKCHDIQSILTEGCHQEFASHCIMLINSSPLVQHLDYFQFSLVQA